MNYFLFCPYLLIFFFWFFSDDLNYIKINSKFRWSFHRRFLKLLFIDWIRNCWEVFFILWYVKHSVEKNKNSLSMKRYFMNADCCFQIFFVKKRKSNFPSIPHFAQWEKPKNSFGLKKNTWNQSLVKIITVWKLREFALTIFREINTFTTRTQDYSLVSRYYRILDQWRGQE